MCIAQPTLPVAHVVAPVDGDVPSLRSREVGRHLRLLEVVRAGGAAAHVALGQRDELQARHPARAAAAAGAVTFWAWARWQAS